MIAAVILLLSAAVAPADVTIDADTISLGALIPLPPGDARASISLGYAPKPGLARRLTKLQILSRIASAGKATADLELPESILVHRRAAGLDRDQVTKAILDAFLQQFPGANLEIDNVEIPDVQVATGPIDISASVPARVEPASEIFVRVELRGTFFVKTVFVRTHIRIEMDQPVLKNRISAHSAIQSGDIEWKMMPVQRASGTDRIDGMAAKRDLEAGQVLTGDLLYMPLYVRKGEDVTVKATAGAVTIAATMRAKTAGKLGETIPVEHLTGNGSTMARVVGPRILEVNR